MSDVIKEMQREYDRVADAGWRGQSPCMKAAARVLLEKVAYAQDLIREDDGDGLYDFDVRAWGRSIGIDLSAPPEGEIADSGSTYTFEDLSLGDADSKRLVMKPETDTE